MTWTQNGDQPWSNDMLGNRSMAAIGCFVVSMAIQIARSGDKEEYFNPGDFLKHLKKEGGLTGNLVTGPAQLGPALKSFTGGNFTTASSFRQSGGGTDKSSNVKLVKTVLDAGYYPVIEISHSKSSMHFIAVDRVEGDKIYTFDPDASKTNHELYSDYKGVSINSIRVFESKTPSTHATGMSATGGNNSTEETEVEISDKDKEALNMARFRFNEEMLPGMPEERDWETDVIPPLEDYDSLEGHQQESLELWKNEVKNDKQFVVTKTARVITMALGISMLMFSLVYLITYMFDKVSFLEFSIFSYLTKGKLAVSHTGESTFFRGGGSGNPKLLNVRDLVVLQFIMIGVSVLILSGGIFAILSGIVYSIEWIQEYWTTLRS